MITFTSHPLCQLPWLGQELPVERTWGTSTDTLAPSICLFASEQAEEWTSVPRNTASPRQPGHTPSSIGPKRRPLLPQNTAASRQHLTSLAFRDAALFPLHQLWLIQNAMVETKKPRDLIRKMVPKYPFFLFFHWLLFRLLGPGDQAVHLIRCVLVIH